MCLKHDNSSKPKNVDITIKMRLLFNSPLVATFSKTWLKKTRPKTCVFCSECKTNNVHNLYKKIYVELITSKTYLF